MKLAALILFCILTGLALGIGAFSLADLQRHGQAGVIGVMAGLLAGLAALSACLAAAQRGRAALVAGGIALAAALVLLALAGIEQGIVAARLAEAQKPRTLGEVLGAAIGQGLAMGLAGAVPRLLSVVMAGLGLVIWLVAAIAAQVRVSRSAVPR
jgi:amino acid transporter